MIRIEARKKPWRLIVGLAARLSLVLGTLCVFVTTASAVDMIFDNETDFLNALADSPSVESFEGLPATNDNIRSFFTVDDFTVSTTAATSGIYNVDFNGQTPTDEENYVSWISSDGETMTFQFDTEQTAFGVYITDAVEDNNTQSLSLSTNGGTSFPDFLVGPQEGGTENFVGITTDVSFTAVTLSYSGSADGLGVDEVYYYAREATECKEFEKQVSVDGGETWFDADDEDSAPTQAVGGGAIYRFIVTNCLVDKKCVDTTITDPVLEIDALVPGSTGDGIILPSEQVIVTKDDKGFVNLDQPDRCDTPGIKKNKATETTKVEGGGPETFMDKAYLNCEGGPCIDVLKEVRGVNADGSMTEWFDANKCDGTEGTVPFSDKDAEYRLIVTNNCSETLTNFTVTDDELGIDINFPNTMLASGTSITVGKGTISKFFKEGVCPDSEFLNTITVSAFGTPSGNEVADSDTACVKCGPCVELVKEVSVDGLPTQDDLKQWFDANACDGSEGFVPSTDSGAEYRLIVKNCGAEDLINFSLEDEQLGINQSFPAFTLSAGDEKIVDAVSVPILAQFLINPSVCPNPEGRLLNTASVFAQGAVSMIEVEDSDPACVTCAECAITIDKKCLVAPPPAGPFECDDKVDALKMIWNGPGTLESVIAYRGKVGEEEIPVSISNDVVTVSGYQPSTNDVQWQWFTKEGGSGISQFHLSCSDDDMNGPEDCGTPQGDGKNEALPSAANVWLLDGLTTDKGFVLDCTPQSAEFLNNCEFEAPPPPNCETLGKPTSLTFRFTGAACSPNSNNQGDKSDCSGVPGPSPVSITILKDPSKIQVNPSSGINVGDLVTVSAIGSDMGSEIQLNVGGQLLKIHTSCSAPLAAGDVFGSLELLQFNGLGSGAEVTYSYEVTNIGNFAVDITSVLDDKLGELLETPPVNLQAGEFIKLEKTAFISETTKNKVTATANLPGDESPCGEAKDQVTVTVTKPTCDVAVVFDNLDDDKIKWKLTNTGKIVATLDTLTVFFPPEYGAIKEVKLDGGIWKKDDSNDYPNGLPPSGITIGSDTVWTNPDITKRQLDPGETRTLEVVFTQKSKGAGWVLIDSAGTATFKEGCALGLIKPADCEIGKPTALVFQYTGEGCVDGNDQADDKWSCSGDPGSAEPVQVVMTKDADKFDVDPDGISLGGTFTISMKEVGKEFPSEIKFDIRQGGLPLQELKIHTSCSQPLAVGDQFGSVIVTEFIPKP